MILSLILSSLTYASPLELNHVLKESSTRLPLILEAQEKRRAAMAELQSSQGAFDTKLKAKTMNQFENKYDNQQWEARLEQQTSFQGLSLYAGQRQGTGLYPVYDQKLETSSVGELFAGVDIPLLRNRDMDEPRLAREQARANASLSEIEWQQKGLDIAVKTGETYWKWVAAGQKLRILEDWVRIAEERQSLLEKKVKLGDVSAVTLTDNQRSLLKRQAELIKIRRDFNSLSEELSLYLGESAPGLERVPQSFELSTDKTTLPPTEQRDSLPAFRWLKAQSAVLRQEERFARALRLPQLNLAIEGARDMGRLPNTQTDPDHLRAGLFLEIPIENNKGRGKVSQVEAKLRALTHRSTWLEREWHTRIEQNKIALSTTREQLVLQDQEVAAATKMARAEAQRLRQGDSDVFFVNLREQDEADARIRLVETKSLHEMMVLERQSLDGELLQTLAFKISKETP